MAKAKKGSKRLNSSRRFSDDKRQGLTRKTRRKQERQAKKARKATFQAKKYGQVQNEEYSSMQNEETEVKSKQPVNKSVQAAKIKKIPKKEKELSAAKMRSIQLKEANEEEDKNIRRLAKQLGIKKRKNKNLFANDGLGYILEVLEQPADGQPQKFKINDSDSDINDDLHDVLGKSTKSRKNNNSENDSMSSDQHDSESDQGYSGSEKESFFFTNSEREANSSKVKKSGSTEKVKRASVKCALEENNELATYRSKELNKSASQPKQIKNKSKEIKLIAKSDDTTESDSSMEESEYDEETIDSESRGGMKNADSICTNVKRLKKQVHWSGSGETINSKHLERLGNSDSLDSETEDDFGSCEDNNENVTNNSKKLHTLIKEKSSKSTSKKKLSSDDNKSNKKAIKRKRTESDSSDSELASDVENFKNDEAEFSDEGCWEDIYGRTRDKEGNIVKITKETVTGTKYVPPAKRLLLTGDDSKKKEELLQINRQIKGLLNRVSESNMKFIADQIEDMYRQHSRNDMNHTLTKLVMDSVVMYALTPERLIMEHCLLLALLHANIGTEIGAHCLQTFVSEFHCKINSTENHEGKEIDNLLMLICHLYTFKVTHNVLIFDIINLLAEKFKEKDVELILLVLRTIGFVLRRDNPMALKDTILSLQSKASAANDMKDQSRVRFMIETIMALKNNNMHKIPNYDPSTAEHLKKVLKGLQRKGTYIQELHISLSDLLHADERGRWWIVGSAWQGSQLTNQDEEYKEAMPRETGKVSQEIMELARKQRMNTESRKNIFCIIMSAEDYMDAFEKLLHLRLKNQQEREIIHVIMDCCLQEKHFNPYYAHLAQKFCNFDRRFKMTMQFAFWDKFKELSNMNANQLKNIAQLLVHQMSKGALPLSILKVIQLSEMEKPLLKFLRQVLLSLLLNESLEDCVGVFRHISSVSKLRLFREGLKLFMHHFLLKNKNKMEVNVAEKLEQRVKLAVDALMEADRR